MNRLTIALAAYIALGILTWMTISEQRVRLVTLAILAMFVVRTLLHRKDAMPADDSGDVRDRPM